jgi:hypothetical protein
MRIRYHLFAEPYTWADGMDDDPPPDDGGIAGKRQGENAPRVLGGPQPAHRGCWEDHNRRIAVLESQVADLRAGKKDT